MMNVLIELVRQRPSIYDKSLPGYKERAKEFAEIARLLNERFNSNLTGS